jgi:plasmid rolling circle replication initiator protein Rep
VPKILSTSGLSGVAQIAEIDQPKTLLVDLSPRDRPWDQHRQIAKVVQEHYKDSEHQKYSDRIDFCSLLLDFGLNPASDGTLALKLRSARFCRVRHCPVCQWRRSLQWQSKAHSILPEVVNLYPQHRWLFLTLTAKNVPINDLKKQIQHFGRSYQRLTQLNNWPATGWLRTLEVTRSANGYAHPHYHCLLLVPSSYYGKNYIKQADWVQLWRRCLRVDYDPIVDIRSVSVNRSLVTIIPEIIKYCTKESDLMVDRDWFLELTTQLHKTRSITTGGVLKSFFKALKEEPEDLIGESEDDASEDFGLIRFAWRNRHKQYQMVD